MSIYFIVDLCDVPFFIFNFKVASFVHVLVHVLGSYINQGCCLVSISSRRADIILCNMLRICSSAVDYLFTTAIYSKLLKKIAVIATYVVYVNVSNAG